VIFKKKIFIIRESDLEAENQFVKKLNETAVSANIVHMNTNSILLFVKKLQCI
jgi:hypothetical protein